MLKESKNKIKRCLIDILLVVFETLYLINNNLFRKESLIAKLLELVRSKRRLKILYYIIVKYIDKYIIKFSSVFEIIRLETTCVKVEISFVL